MKQKDIVLIAVIVVISAIASFVISTKLFVTPKNRQQNVEVVDVISPDFAQPNPKYFNSSSVDAAQLVEIGNNNNQNPFSGGSQ